MSNQMITTEDYNTQTTLPLLIKRLCYILLLILSKLFMKRKAATPAGTRSRKTLT
jgi:hypothetical protein